MMSQQPPPPGMGTYFPFFIHVFFMLQYQFITDFSGWNNSYPPPPPPGFAPTSWGGWGGPVPPPPNHQPPPPGM